MAACCNHQTKPIKKVTFGYVVYYEIPNCMDDKLRRPSSQPSMDYDMDMDTVPVSPPVVNYRRPSSRPTQDNIFGSDIVGDSRRPSSRPSQEIVPEPVVGNPRRPSSRPSQEIVLPPEIAPEIAPEPIIIKNPHR